MKLLFGGINQEGNKECLRNNKEMNYQTIFIHCSISKGLIIEKEVGIYNYVIFLIKGACRLEEKLKEKHIIYLESFFSLSHDQTATIEIEEDCNFIFLKYESLNNSFDTAFLESLEPLKEKIKYSFTTLPIRNPLNSFLNLVITTAGMGLDSLEYQRCAKGLFFIYLRQLYTKEEILQAFYSTVCAKMDFKKFVLENYMKVKTIEQLASMMHIAKSTFYKRFNKEFGLSAQQWIINKKKECILLNSTQSNMTVKSLMYKSGFDTASNFTRFCKSNFGCTPTELLENKKITNDIPPRKEIYKVIII